MICGDAMLTHFVSARPDQTVGDALDLLERHHLQALPVVDAQGICVGRFSFDELIGALLPSSVFFGKKMLKKANLRLDFLVGGEPANLAKSLGELRGIPVGDLMDATIRGVHPDTGLWEGMRILKQTGSPIPVCDADSNRLVGVLSAQAVTQLLVQALRP